MGETDNYEAFVSEKLSRVPPTGLQVVPALSDALRPFQADLVAWALRRGRAAIFADTGLGKTRVQIEWARHVANATACRVLILAPLAVAAQTAREGAGMGAPIAIVREPEDITSETGPIVITNYDRIHKFDAASFGGVALDESSIIKHHNAKTLQALLVKFALTPYKLCLTATPAPNDYTELGTHAEFLGICTRTEMLAEFFCHDGGETQVWRLKGHARALFWKWVSSWGALLRRPSDLGYDDGAYALPSLNVQAHTIAADHKQAWASGYLFVSEASSLSERRAARKGSMSARVEACARVVNGECRCGSLSTQPTESRRPRRTQSTEHGETLRAAPAPKKSRLPICEPTTRPTEGSTSRPRRSESRKRIPNGEQDTKLTLSTGSGPKRSPEIGPEPIQKRRSRRTCARTELRQSNSETSSISREADAPSAAEKKTLAVEADCTSTTAIARASFGEFYAHRATSGSASSPTTLTESSAPQCTCASNADEQWIVWCALNSEQDALEETFGDQAVSIRGDTDLDERVVLHGQWLRGEKRVLITKCALFGWGLNWQHCARMAFVGVDDSWEAYYQAIRRCWRFGQHRQVDVHIFASEIEGAVVANLERKERDALAMSEELSLETRGALLAEVRGLTRETNDYRKLTLEIPAWMRRAG